MHADNLHQRGVEQEAAVVVEKLGVGIGVIHFHIDLILTHAADGDPLRCAVAAAEADSGFGGEHVFHVGGSALVDAAGVHAVGGRYALAAHMHGFEAGSILRGIGVGGLGETAAQGKREQAEGETGICLHKAKLLGLRPDGKAEAAGNVLKIRKKELKTEKRTSGFVRKPNVCHDYN